MIVKAVGYLYVEGLQETEDTLEDCHAHESKEKILSVLPVVDETAGKEQPVIRKEMHRILTVEHISGGILTGIE